MSEKQHRSKRKTQNEKHRTKGQTMNRNLKTRIVLPLVAGLLAFSATHGRAASTTYRFTGTVTDSDLYRPFTVDLGVVLGLEVKIGDPVTGTLEIKSKPLAFPPDIYGPRTGTYAYLGSVQTVLINGTELSSGLAPTYAIVANDVTQEMPGRLEGTQLAESGDAYVLVVSSQDTRGVISGGQSLSVADYVDIKLNLTDSAGTIFSDSSHPNALDAQKFDIRRGFVTPAGWGGGDSNRGILFSIDTLEIIGTNGGEDCNCVITTPDPIPTVSTGFHVSWPRNAEGYVLEEAESPEGPWLGSAGTTVVVEGRKIVVMDMQSRSKLYRLTKAN